MTADVAIQAVIDQKTATQVRDEVSVKCLKNYARAASFHVPRNR